MSTYEQLPMFGGEDEGKSAAPSEERLYPGTPLERAVAVYLVALRLGGASEHTVKAFRSDLRLLADWAGPDYPIGVFATADLNAFLHWMLTERDKPCSPKTYARRVTALKNFFGYLHNIDAIPFNPALALIQHSARSALPDILYAGELERVLAFVYRLRMDRERPDARPLLLITLLLQTGIKKGECMGLRLSDVDRHDPAAPFIWVRYTNPRLRYKERKIPVDPAWLEVLDEYLAQRRPQRRLFECTARNLEYVLRDVAVAVGVQRSKLSFESLRWTCAVRDYLAGMDEESLRQKLGLSRISWRETFAKLAQLAEAFGQ